MARPHYLRAGSSEKDEGWGRKEDGKKIRFPIKKSRKKAPALTPLALEWQRELVDRIMNKTQNLS